MISIATAFQLQEYNTFGLSATAENLIQIKSEADLLEVYKREFKPIHILGGGSNILLTKDIQGYVLKSEIRGFDIMEESDHHVKVEVGAGENWHDFVLWAIERNYGGIENLSLIPGTVGAAPIQNIGAYGVEQKDVFHSLSAFNLFTGKIESFSNKACDFGYRDSYFKHEGKGKYFITRVTYTLTKHDHIMKVDYGDIQKQLAEKKLSKFTVRDISECIISIRSSKLPDPKFIGNAGSFFKNPVINIDLYQKLLVKYPEMPHYATSSGQEVKVPAAWLIDQLGYKGYDRDGIGVHDKQALVLVNRKNGQGSLIHQLAQEIQNNVFTTYSISLEMEVNVW